jgi:hypothetical protein
LNSAIENRDKNTKTRSNVSKTIYKVYKGAIQIVALSICISLSGSTVDGNPFYRFFAFPPSMETLFKNVLPFHRRWKLFSKMFCLSIVGGDPFQKYFGVPPETVAIYVFFILHLLPFKYFNFSNQINKTNHYDTQIKTRKSP